MAQRWTFEEDYFICKFVFRHPYDTLSEQDINCLLLAMKEHGFSSRSVAAIIKRFKAYKQIFDNYNFSLATNQVQQIAEAYLNRLENPLNIQEDFDLTQSKIQEICDDNMQVESLFESPSLFSSYLTDIAPPSPSFKELLLTYMRKKGLTETDVYKGSFVSRDKFSHIINGRKGKNIKPDKSDKAHVSQRTAMQLCIGLKLTYEEAVYFMSCAGHAFSPHEDVDRVVVACLKHHICNIVEVNIELYECGYELFKEPNWRTEKKNKAN